MNWHRCLAGLFSLSSLACGQKIDGVRPETDAALKTSPVLDQLTAVQGNKILKIERLNTPDEEMIKALESPELAANSVVPTMPERNLPGQKSYFVSAQVFDHTYTLLTFGSLDGGRTAQTQVWSNITAWDEWASSPVFESGDTQYTLLILPSAAQSGDESPKLPVNLPTLAEGKAYFQGAEQALESADLDFMENLHLYYELRENQLSDAHRKKVEEHRNKVASDQREARQQKSITLRFWRQEDKSVVNNPTPHE